MFIAVEDDSAYDVSVGQAPGDIEAMFQPEHASANLTVLLAT